MELEWNWKMWLKNGIGIFGIWYEKHRKLNWKHWKMKLENGII